jgi:hypothetical protein
MVAVAAVVIFRPCLQARVDKSRIPVVPRSLILNRIYNFLFKPKLEALTIVNFSESRRKSTSESRAKNRVCEVMSPMAASVLAVEILHDGNRW